LSGWLIAEEEALKKKGMEEKIREFAEEGNEIYARPTA